MNAKYIMALARLAIAEREADLAKLALGRETATTAEYEAAVRAAEFYRIALADAIKMQP